MAFIDAYKAQDHDALVALMSQDFSRLVGSTDWVLMSKEKYRAMHNVRSAEDECVLNEIVY